jgi:pimeloyl-ACP methyl ester carboxylesterase
VRAFAGAAATKAEQGSTAPVPTSSIVSGLIPGATLTLFPDAGHAFLLQDQATLVPQIESFLG